MGLQLSRNHDDNHNQDLVPADARAAAVRHDIQRRRRNDTAEYAAAPLQLEEPSPFKIKEAGTLTPHRTFCLALRPDCKAAQQYRLLHYKLKEGANPRLIGVTSAAPREGKTTVSGNLAFALAENQRAKVALVDLNLRGPAMARRLGLSLFGSLGDQLRLKQRHTRSHWEVLGLRDNLHLMAGGEPLENPSPLLNSDQLGILFDDLAAHYDYVVVDLPAILIAADTGSIQDYLDALVLVCRAGFSRQASVSEAARRLGDRRLNGVLMLDVEGRFVVQ